jgi:LYR motif-containing protein 4
MTPEIFRFGTFFFREYAVRRIKDAFQANKKLGDTHAINDQLSYAAKNLAIIRRQVT